MNRPRPSVLQLFDPLSIRDTQSPDSDKENSSPCSDFFPQTHVQHPSPVRLTRRLIEVGDVTVDAGGGDDSGGEEDDEEDENDTIGRHPPSSPRTPLADVTFDRERTPMRSKTYRRKPNAGEVAVPSPALDNYAFAAVIDAVNASGATFGDSHAAPPVVISPPEEDDSSPNGSTDTVSASLATLSLATPTGSLITDTTMAFPTPSEPSPSLLAPSIQPPPQVMSSFSLDCSSADLQSSFALHMNMNSETSFDLLNDRISFLGHNDEESFDMEKELGPISEQDDLQETGGADTFSFLCVSNIIVGENFEFLVKTSIESEPCLVTPSADVETPEPPSDSTPRSRSPLVQLADATQESLDTVPGASAIPVQPPTVSALTPVFVPPVQYSSPIPVLSTTLPEPPALVPALKIVKRLRPETTTAPQVTVKPGAVDNLPLPDRKPPAGNCVPADRASTVPPAGRYVMEGPGPWRVPVSGSDKDREKVANAPNQRKLGAGTALSGPRRVPLPSAAPIPAPAPVPAPAATKALPQSQTTASLKRPLRAVPPNGSTSGLPRPCGDRAPP
ncbi:hypothetical protein DFH08DRAFT_375714 [Mycena albidolilacea]|uniref:Uncharacterized protein n=1 Tax=Mycena albidolilacea TaxID=1033008 RepID=A0AAD7AKS4_9AGAR|nr:hypothetical protein DFH08DRAFT_375714 [Mycena albidolilacea]